MRLIHSRGRFDYAAMSLDPLAWRSKCAGGVANRRVAALLVVEDLDVVEELMPAAADRLEGWGCQ
jgi:hypothetical protein